MADEKSKRETHLRHREDNWVDSVTIETVPRWKTSGLSGDEWRFSTRVTLWRKGFALVQSDFGSLPYASAWTTQQLLFACPADQPWPDDAPGQRYGDGYFCDNPGCPQKATVKGVLKARYSREGFKDVSEWTDYFRVFCDEHKDRGDCALEDANENYVFEPLS